MARKKRSNAAIPNVVTQAQANTSEIKVTEPEPQAESGIPAASPAERPARVDGPPTNPSIDAPDTDRTEPKQWADPYKPVFSSTVSGFEMGENRRFKQRVFKFHKRPDQSVIDILTESGFTYRPAEKSWTIQATPETRRLSEELAHQFAGEAQGRSR